MLICNLNKCTGCGLCASLCPKKSITFKSMSLGHVYPQIDEQLCINCGLCKKICPSNNIIEGKLPDIAYAGWTKNDKDYITTTSGGLATVLSKHVINKGGIVYGSAVVQGGNIKHIRVTELSQIERLKGSKYVQSSIREILPKIKEDVLNGFLTLFIGTPCQVAAVNQLMKRDYDNLILVDIICHGTPSNVFLKDYISKYLKIDINLVDDIKFRLPDSFSLVVSSLGKVLYQSKNLWTNRYQDLYYNTFIDGYTYRESCYECQYANPHRISDITIGDFWELGKLEDDSYIPEHTSGISCILPLTEKGKMIIMEIQSQLNLYERNPQEAINGNDQLRSPKKKNFRVKLFRTINKLVDSPSLYNIVNCDKIFKYKLKKFLRK